MAFLVPLKPPTTAPALPNIRPPTAALPRDTFLPRLIDSCPMPSSQGSAATGTGFPTCKGKAGIFFSEILNEITPFFIWQIPNTFRLISIHRHQSARKCCVIRADHDFSSVFQFPQIKHKRERTLPNTKLCPNLNALIRTLLFNSTRAFTDSFDKLITFAGSHGK